MKKLTLAKRREIETKRQYRFEVNAEILEPFRVQLPLKQLIDFASDFWDHEGRSFMYFPTIKFGKGMRHRKGYISFADLNNNYIELIKGERDKITMLHEMLHVVGFPYHNSDFFKAQIHYLHLFCDFDLHKLVKDAEKFNLKYKL